MTDSLLNDARNKIQAQGLAVKQIAVRQDGDLIASHVFEQEDRLPLWSVSKAFTSLAAGQAIQEGLFGLNDVLADYFPEYQAPECPITVRDALRMATGHGDCPVMRRWYAGQPIGDICQLFFDEPMTTPHGAQWFYDNSGFYMVARLITATSGMSIRDYLIPRLFDPLDIAVPEWDLCDLGYVAGFYGLRLTAREVAKVGQLLLDGGRGLIPPDYLSEMTRVQTDNSANTQSFATPDHRSGYGYGVWMCRYPGSYRMDGLFGQYCVIIPDRKAVVTLLSNEPVNMTGVLDLVWDTVLDKL